MRRIALGEKNHVGVRRATLGVDTDHASAMTDQALHGGLAGQHHAMLARYLGKIAVINRSQDGVAGVVDAGAADRSAEQRVPVVEKGATLDEPPLVGCRLDGLPAESLFVLEVLGEVNGARPVLGAREDGRFADEHREASTTQRRRSGNAGRTRTYDYGVEMIASRGVLHEE